MKKIFLTILTIALLAPALARAESFPDFPMMLWGNLKINGAVAPAGTELRAYYGSILAGKIVTTQSGLYGSSSVTGQKLIVSKGSGAITFKIVASGYNSGAETGGTVAQTISGFTSSTVNHDFNFTITVTTNNPPPSGGGGGGDPVLPPVNPPATTTPPVLPPVVPVVDANKDNKVDVLDFNTLMVSWGKTGTGLSTDFNKDGKVDVFDFNLLMVNWTV